MLKVLVVDDSAFMRRLITSILASDPELYVLGQARNGAEALEMTVNLKPDVVTLDVEMPGVNGYAALKAIMSARPTPVIMLSSLTREGAEATIHCLELGAVDFVAKPSGSISLDLEKIGVELIAKVKAAGSPAARATLRPNPGVARRRFQAGPSASAVRCVFIGTSTGGPRALRQVIPLLPADLGVPVFVVQHMPAGFTNALAVRLNSESQLDVREAAPGDRLAPNTVLIAPGGLHTEINTDGVLTMNEAPAVNGVRPAADITLSSIINLYGGNTVGVLLTGMGRDGASALKKLRDVGGRTMVESQETCVVYGMPRAAVEIDAAESIIPLHDIASEIVRLTRSPLVKAAS